jgi:phosphatidylglycerophosphatase C
MSRNIVVFDFDHTIYKGDSSIDFYFFFLKKYPIYFVVLFYQFFFYCLFKLKLISVENFKSRYFVFLTVLDEKSRENLINEFWDARKSVHFNQNLMNTFDFFKSKEIDIVIASASLYLILDAFKERHGIDLLIATEAEFSFKGLTIHENCRGIVKIRRLKEKYSDFTIVEAYSDNYDDSALLRMAQKGYWVKGNHLILYNSN